MTQTRTVNCRSFLFKRKEKRIMNDILVRLPNETEDQCLWRIGKAKDSGILTDNWPEIAAFLNKTFREDETQYYDSSAYRKKYRNFVTAYEGIFSKERFTDEEMMTIVEQKRELEKAKIKLRDERLDYQKTVREEARKESIVDLVRRVFTETVVPFDYTPSHTVFRECDDELVICLSDLHAGIVCDNYWNQFNTNILRERLHKYLDEIRDIQKTHLCRKCYVVLGGDNVSGLIHANLRLQNNENVVKQLKIASEYIGNFVKELIDMDTFEEIEVRSVAGNHSRMSQNKEEHLKGEELDELIPFYLNLMFANVDMVKIYEESPIDSTINSFTTSGNKLFYIVHGDKDSVSKVVSDLTLMVGRKPDGIIMGHRHHNALDSAHNVKVIQCGCVVGTDTHCVDHRISGEPEQCVFITNKNRTVKCLYDIGLN
jgi:hypothetical protein